MRLDVVTPQGAKIRDMEVREVTLPGLLGEMGILPGHEAMVAALDIGPMVVETPSGRQVYALASGFVEVMGDHVRVLAETCERSDEIDIERARAKVEEDEGRLETVHPVEGEAYNVLAASLKKARTRVLVASGK